MSTQFQRVGAVRAALIVLGGAIVAILGLSSSGLSVGGPERPLASVSPQVNASTAVAIAVRVPSAAPRRAVRRSGITAQPKRKRCRPVDGVMFTVSARARCPRPLKTARRPHGSALLRKAASRSQPTVAAEPVQTTTRPGKTAPTTVQAPAEPTTAAQPAKTTPNATPTTTGGTPAGSSTVTARPRSGRSAPND
jgi:hypothetical protein